jgi:hypothetical protein
MARSSIVNIVEDLQSDSGSVLFSFVQGEALEFPVTLSFIDNASVGYTYEAVLIEGNNVSGDSTPPTVARTGGIQTVLTVFVPTWRGTWSAASSYNRDDLIAYNGIYYIAGGVTGYISAVLPSVDTGVWTVYVPNKVYIQFPETLSLDWNVIGGPTAEAPVHGFFELRVTEPVGGRFRRTWKPMRGLVSFAYSPTQAVP